tara:strand:- start:1836 stop:3146 length:1311 start_codon:yes stop_codon:yes gene_type:complete
MNKNKKINICIAGLGTVGANVIDSLCKNKDLIFNKLDIEFDIKGISAKTKSKKRIFDINKYEWFDNPLDLIDIDDCKILIELIGQEKGLSFELIKKSLEKKINVVTANKALLSKHGTELFEIAEKNNVLLLYEAAVAGGIPIIRVIKQSIFLNRIKKISGILNGTTNYILSEMESHNLDFNEVLKKAQSNGYVESDPTNDIEGIDSAHKLSLLSTLCFGSVINFDNISYRGISDIEIEDINNAKKLGYRIKLISESTIINNKMMSVVEPKLVREENYLSNVKGVLNAIKIETDHLKPLILEGEGAGGKATASSIISDLFEITTNSNTLSLGYKIKKLKKFAIENLSEIKSSFYLRILTKDIPGVLAEITSNLNNEGISIETILQIPDKDSLSNKVPIIIVTHETKKDLLIKVINKIEKLEFVLSKIAIINIDKSFG